MIHKCNMAQTIQQYIKKKKKKKKERKKKKLIGILSHKSHFKIYYMYIQTSQQLSVY